MNAGLDMFEALCYRLRVFRVPIYGSANMFCDKEAVYKNTITPESVPNKKHNYISYHRYR